MTKAKPGRRRRAATAPIIKGENHVKHVKHGKHAASPRGNTAGDGISELSLRLYVAGRGANSVRALDNLRALFAAMGIAPSLEIIDVLEAPARALDDGIIVTPTLVRQAPLPVIRVIGDLTDQRRVRIALGLAEAEGAA